MYGSTLCLGLIGGTNVHGNEQIKIISAAGFDGFFSAWTPNIFGYKDLANDLGMIYQSIHAPFNRADKIWHDGDEADSVRNELLKCVEDCARLEVPILVVHPYAGVPKCDIPPESGIENYSTVISRAEQLGVKIAFENVSQPIYLNALMTAFKNSDNVGFCFDTGHQLCYNSGTDMMALYGDRLIHTHLNDNLGVSGKEITWHDDLHLPVGEGIGNWSETSKKIFSSGYNDVLMCELTLSNKPDRHELDRFAAMPIDEFYAFSLKCVKKLESV
jgi:sugar phosphate isomerase/epimerase